MKGLMRGRGRLLIALAMVIFSLISYYGTTSYNPITGEDQHVALTVDEEIALGLQSAPQMANQHGGALSDVKIQALVDDIGEKIVNSTAAGDTDYQFEFTVLADAQTINAFALPGGPIFITTALLKRLETEGQLAGVLGHEIGHVVARHSAEQIAQSELIKGISGAAAIAAYDPNNPQGGQQAAAVAQMIGKAINMKYGRDDEIEADTLGVRFIAKSGYDPRALIGVMKILAEASQGNNQPEFFSTHPNPENRIANIEEAIAIAFPDGVPDGLIQ